VDFRKLFDYKDFGALVEDALNKLKSYGTKITNQNVGGVWRTLTEAAMQGIADVYDLLIDMVPQGYAVYAEGQWLDLKCEDIGLHRHDATKTEGAVTFRRLNTSGSVVIPSGTVVKTEIAPSGDTLRYITTADGIMADGQTEIDVPVAAEFEGAQYNIGPGMITEIVTYVSGIDGVQNKEGWISKEGTDRESDDSLRERYFLKWSQIAVGDPAEKYVSWAKEVPGVVEVKVDDQLPRGQGTVDVIITGPEGIPSQALIDAVQSYIEPRKPNTANVLVKGPVTVYADITATICLPSSYGDETEAYNNATAALYAMFDAMTIGDSLYGSRIIAVLMGVKDVIKADLTGFMDITALPNQYILPGEINISVVRL
jgi:uncharacterized phage protein gp47/JayE